VQKRVSTHSGIRRAKPGITKGIDPVAVEKRGRYSEFLSRKPKAPKEYERVSPQVGVKVEQVKKL